MAYIDRTGLEQRFGVAEIADLLDDDNSGTESGAETNSLTRACEDAQNLIDGYLASRYTLPLVSIPALVTVWAADIARFKLWDEKAPEEVRQRYEDALAQLKLLSEGKIALPPGSDGMPAAPPIQFDGYSNCRVFTEDTLRGY